jgi:hypothetical protein
MKTTMKRLIIILCTVLFFVILFLVLKWDNDDLGDNYFYLPPYQAIDVGYPGGAIIYKSPAKNIIRDVKIHREVIRVNSNKDFIIAIQQQKDSSNTNKIGLLYYFIIVKKSDIVYGPFKKEEYVQKREELGVPNNLQLDDEG